MRFERCYTIDELPQDLGGEVFWESENTILAVCVDESGKLWQIEFNPTTRLLELCDDEKCGTLEPDTSI